MHGIFLILKIIQKIVSPYIDILFPYSRDSYIDGIIDIFLK